MRPRHVTALVLGKPELEHAANWLEIAPREAGVAVISESFARRRLPPQAFEAMRENPCFYMCVDDIRKAVAHVPGRRIGKPVTAHGMREVCVATPSGMVVLAQPA